MFPPYIRDLDPLLFFPLQFPLQFFYVSFSLIITFLFLISLTSHSQNKKIGEKQKERIQIHNKQIWILSFFSSPIFLCVFLSHHFYSLIITFLFFIFNFSHFTLTKQENWRGNWRGNWRETKVEDPNP
jgi:hypothetical protein